MEETKKEKLQAVDLLVYVHGYDMVVFEPDWNRPVKNDMVRCKTGCNTRFFSTGKFPEFACHLDFCSAANEDSRKVYFHMKDDQFKDLDQMAETKEEMVDAFPQVTSVLQENSALKETIGALTEVISHIQKIINSQRSVPSFIKGVVSIKDLECSSPVVQDLINQVKAVVIQHEAGHPLDWSRVFKAIDALEGK